MKKVFSSFHVTIIRLILPDPSKLPMPEPDAKPDRDTPIVLALSSFLAVVATFADFAVFAEPHSKYPAIVAIFSFRILL
jgi:hypothetical protein